jgi:hypothetical protein
VPPPEQWTFKSGGIVQRRLAHIFSQAAGLSQEDLLRDCFFRGSSNQYPYGKFFTHDVGHILLKPDRLLFVSLFRSSQQYS